MPIQKLLTLEEYLDPKRFPLTTRTHYKPEDQFFMDAFNFKNGVAAIEAGEALTDEEAKIQAELTEKMSHMPRLRAEKEAEDKAFYKKTADVIKADREWEKTHGGTGTPRTKDDEVIRKLD